MKRRDFLKILSIAPVVAAVPALAKANKTNYEHVDEAGRLMDAADIQYNYLDAMNKSIARTADALLDVIPKPYDLGLRGEWKTATEIRKAQNKFQADFDKKIVKTFLKAFEKGRVTK